MSISSAEGRSSGLARTMTAVVQMQEDSAQLVDRGGLANGDNLDIDGHLLLEVDDKQVDVDRMAGDRVFLDRSAGVLAVVLPSPLTSGRRLRVGLSGGGTARTRACPARWASIRRRRRKQLRADGRIGEVRRLVCRERRAALRKA